MELPDDQVEVIADLVVDMAVLEGIGPVEVAWAWDVDLRRWIKIKDGLPSAEELREYFGF